MKHFILFCLIISFSACSIFQGMPWSDDAAPEEFLSDDDGVEDSNSDSTEISTKPEEVSTVDEDDIEYIDPEDEDLLDEEVIVEEEIELENSSSDLVAMEEGAVANGVTGLEEDFFSSPTKELKESSVAPAVKPLSSSKKKKYIPLKKIKDQTYQIAKYLVNAVYIARAGDTVESVSQKIFNSDEQDQLYTINPYLRRRASGLKVGDKVYYQSPTRTQDNSRLLFYFEDIGASPKYYRIEVGQNIRKIASDLLGSMGGSWKEIWSTNPDLISKTVVNEAVEIKYWTSVEQAALDSPIVEDAPSTPDDIVGAPTDTPSAPQLPSEEEESSSIDDSPPAIEDFQPDTPSTSIEEKQFDFSIENILLMALAAFSLILAIVLFKRRKKRAEYDFTAANFEMDDEDK